MKPRIKQVGTKPGLYRCESLRLSENGFTVGMKTGYGRTMQEAFAVWKEEKEFWFYNSCLENDLKRHVQKA